MTMVALGVPRTIAGDPPEKTSICKLVGKAFQVVIAQLVNAQHHDQFRGVSSSRLTSIPNSAYPKQKHATHECSNVRNSHDTISSKGGMKVCGRR
jgi:hypothetical protein